MSLIPKCRSWKKVFKTLIVFLIWLSLTANIKGRRCGNTFEQGSMVSYPLNPFVTGSNFPWLLLFKADFYVMQIFSLKVPCNLFRISSTMVRVFDGVFVLVNSIIFTPYIQQLPWWASVILEFTCCGCIFCTIIFCIGSNHKLVTSKQWWIDILD